MQYIPVNLDQAKDMVVACMKANLTPMLSGAPGLGKSSIVKKIAEEFNMELLDVRLSTCDSTDLNGLPNFKDGKATFTPFDIFPTEDTPLPLNKTAFLLFLDEFNSASRSVAVAAYKLVLDRMVGQHKLHPLCFIVCAGNREEDNAIVNDLGTAMQSRLVHINVETDNEVWLKNVALTEDYDPRVIAYLQNYPGDLMNFNPEHTEQTFSCPRTWSYVNQLIKGKEKLNNIDEALITGCLGMSVGSKFYTYTEIFTDIPTINDIINDPVNTKLPKDINKKWAVICMVMTQVNKDNLNKVVEYVDKFDTPFKVLFYRSIFAKNDDLKSNPVITKKLVTLSKYIFG